MKIWTWHGCFFRRRKTESWWWWWRWWSLCVMLWMCSPSRWDLNCNPVVCCFVWRHAGGEIQAGQRQRRRRVGEQRREPRRRTAALRHRQETVRLCVRPGKTTSSRGRHLVVTNSCHHVVDASLVSDRLTYLIPVFISHQFPACRVIVCLEAHRKKERHFDPNHHTFT